MNSIVVWPMLWLYMFINHHQAPPSNIVLMPSWVPFWPAFFPVYFAMMLVTWLLPVAIADAGRFRACLRANVCAWLLVMPWWILSPTMMPRPALPDGVWAYVFDCVWTVDLPYNVRPCAHGIGPVVATWFFVQEQPSRVRDDLARSLRVDRERVRVIVPDTGGGFGGKHSGEAAVEAARLALEAQRPISLRWTREEEFTWAYFRPAGVIDLAASLDEKKNIIAWQHINFLSGTSGIGCPYNIADAVTEFRNCDAPLRSGSYRALASTANNFARECFIDELAAAAGADPLEYRLRHLTNERMRAVLKAAADKFEWSRKWKNNSKPQSAGVGIACGTEKGSYVACCARVEVNEQNGQFKLVEIVEAFECGAIQNPANLRAQVEGCIIQGLGGALREEMRFKDGKILNGKFSQYKVPRFKDVPKIETVLLNRPDLPSVGAGETPIIGIAPALANAILNAVQVSMRSMPLRHDKYRPV